MSNIAPNQQPAWLLEIATKIDKVCDNVKDLKNRLDDIANTASFAADEAREAKNSMIKLAKEVESLRDENAQLKSEIHDLHRRSESMEAQSRRQNLLFDGIPEQEDETWDMCEANLNGLLAEHMQSKALCFERVHRVGRKVGNKSRQVVAKFSSYKQRDLVWKNRCKLIKAQTYG